MVNQVKTTTSQFLDPQFSQARKEELRLKKQLEELRLKKQLEEQIDYAEKLKKFTNETIKPKIHEVLTDPNNRVLKYAFNIQDVEGLNMRIECQFTELTSIINQCEIGRDSASYLLSLITKANQSFQEALYNGTKRETRICAESIKPIFQNEGLDDHICQENIQATFRWSTNQFLDITQAE